MDDVREKIDGTDQKIVRFKKPVVNNDGDLYTVYWVAIKIGEEGNRDYTALKDYIVASDNRTYNKVVRNMIEYIEVENREVPKNKTKLPFNLLVSGAPGTGKSHFLSEEILKAGNKIIERMIEADQSNEGAETKKATAEQEYCSDYVTRVTFYEDYSYCC